MAELAGGARQARPDARARSARRRPVDGGRGVRRRPVRPAGAPLWPAARPDPGGHRAARRRHGRPRRRPGREERGRLRPAQALHRCRRPAGRAARADRAPAPPAGCDVHASSPRSGDADARSSRWRRPASSTRGRRSCCWCGSRARSPRALAEQARGAVGGELVEDDEELWAEHRERAAGLQPALAACRRRLPARRERLRAAGATDGRRPLRARPAARRRAYAGARRRPQLEAARAARGGGVRSATTRELLDACVHCGFCLPACPTYTLWGERDGLAARPHPPDDAGRVAARWSSTRPSPCTSTAASAAWPACRPVRAGCATTS